MNFRFCAWIGDLSENGENHFDSMHADNLLTRGAVVLSHIDPAVTFFGRLVLPNVRCTFESPPVAFGDPDNTRSREVVRATQKLNNPSALSAVARDHGKKRFRTEDCKD